MAASMDCFLVSSPAPGLSFCKFLAHVESRKTIVLTCLLIIAVRKAECVLAAYWPLGFLSRLSSRFFLPLSLSLLRRSRFSEWVRG